MKKFKPFLLHILDEINYLLQNSKNLAYENFINDETLKRSFSKSLEIIGEAVKNIPENFRNKYPKVQWKEIAGLRDVLVHDYFGIDYVIVWDIIKRHIPKLKEDIEVMLDEID